MKYITLTTEQVHNLAAGDAVPIKIGKRIHRILTTKTEREIKRENLLARHQAELMSLERLSPLSIEVPSVS